MDNPLFATVNPSLENRESPTATGCPASLSSGGQTPCTVPDAKKSLGRIHGHAVYFGAPAATLIVAEGIETALSLRTACPDLGAAATLGATGLTAFTPPPGVARLLIARDDDPAGDDASERLCVRCRTRGVDARVFIPRRGDFNDDLLDDGPAALAMRIAEALRR